MRENAEPAQRLSFVQTVEHAVSAMGVGCPAVADLNLAVKALQRLKRRKITKQVAPGRRQLDRGHE